MSKVKKHNTAFESRPNFCFSSRETGRRRHDPVLRRNKIGSLLTPFGRDGDNNIRALEKVDFAVNTHVYLFHFYKR